MSTDQLVVLHDAALYRYPKTFSVAYRIWHKFLDAALSRICQVATVSEFSRAELATCLGLPAEQIIVLPNGAGHLNSVPEDSGIMERLNLKVPFFLAVGSGSPRKNLGVIGNAVACPSISNAGAPAFRIVITGGTNARVFGGTNQCLGSAIIWAGHLTDAQMVALYRRAAALVFPSVYEGFGLPLVEAMGFGCPLIASDIPSTREVCGDAARYFAPDDPAELAEAMLAAASGDVARPGAHVRYCWADTADRLLTWVSAGRG